MDRRTLIGAGLAGTAAAGAARAADEVEAVKARLIAFYRAFADPKTERARYLSFTTEDYLLCEDGSLLDRVGDLKLLETLPPDWRRVDRFDFRRVTVAGDQADLVYFLESDISESKHGLRRFRWLESALMRRQGGEWRCALLHSTKIAG